MSTEKLQLTLHASGLKNVAGAFKGTSDPFAIVTILGSGPNEKPRVLGKTEVIKNNLSPKWTTSFLFDYEFGKETHINISIVDEVRKKNDKPMGSAVFEIGDILGSRGSIKAQKLKKGGTLYVRLQKPPQRNAGALALVLSGHKLKNVEGLFKKSDPFYEIRRTYDGPNSGSWHAVYRSKQVKDNLSPNWEPATVDVNALCDGDLDRKVQIAIFDHESDGKHQSMGQFETTVNALMKAAEQKTTFTPKKGSKDMGAIRVNQCKITGADSSQHVASAAVDPSGLPMPVPVPLPIEQMGNMSLGAGQKPSFVDYVTGNCDLGLCVAIDFTGSNGDPRKPGTLHHISRDGMSMNGYEKAITAVGGILSKYDTDQMFPVWGFGAKYDGVVRHCFQVGRSKEVHGVNGILEAYRGVFKTALTMSGPTVFTEVIELAAAQAISRQQLKPLSYTILLLLTDGAVSDVAATKRTLQSIADAPLSIVIVGIGNADFSAMQFLDDFETRNSFNRDIVQFVEFRHHEYDKMSLTRATLDEIPEQLVQFFHARGIMPQPDTNFSTSKIVVEDVNEHEEEIDLSMDYNPDGEIVLNGDQSAGYIDTHSYQPAQNMPTPIPPPVVASAAAVPIQQPFTFQVQCPPGVSPGMQLQVQHPKTGQVLLVAVPQGIQPGGVFNVSA